MLTLSNLSLFLAATVALNLTPGPDIAYVLASSARDGPRGSILASLGISCGIVLHTCLAAFGVAGLLLAHPWAIQLLRTLGAAYLIVLGVSKFRSASSAAAPAVPADGRLLWRGFITNACNPKVALFFLAFLPQFVDFSKSTPTLQVLFLGLIFVLSGTVVNIAYAFAGGWASAAMRRDPRWRTSLERLSATVFVLLGVRLLVPWRSG